MLSRLELKGFKSFAGAVTLDFGPGINVIVGPNGSGKSNLSEAITWALGEQRAGKLRAPSMTEVIFSGGANRSPAGLAEVTLAIGDADGGVELEATRRLTRTGDSDYRVNGNGCRLIDLQERLSSYGLGPEGLAVIRQGQVEALCTSRPEDRRSIIEEAAGVGVSKRRRHRAGLKLARVADRLDRANDIAREVAARARTLDRQAAAATRAAEVDAELLAARELQRLAHAAQAHRLAAEAKVARDAAAAARTAAIAERDAGRVALEASETRRTEAAKELAAADERALALRGAAERVTARAEALRDRVDGALDQASRAAREHAEAVAELAAIESGEEELRAAFTAAETAHAERRAALRDAEDRVAAATRRLQELDELAAAERQRAARRTQELEEARHELSRLQALSVQLSERVARISSDGGSLDRLARAERRAEISRGRVERWTGRCDEARSVVDAAAAGLAAAEASRKLAAEEVARVGGTARDAGDFQRLGDGVTVDRGMERAVAAALGSLADAALADGARTAATFLDDGAEAVVVPAPARQARPPKGARPILEVVRSGDPVRQAHLERVLAETWLVESLDGIDAGATGCFVTPEGVAWRPADGVVSGARSEWARRTLRERAGEALVVAEAEIGPARAALDAARAAAAAAERRLRAADRSAGRADAAIAAGRQASAQEAAQRDLLTAERTDLDARQAVAEERLRAAQAEPEATSSADADAAREAAAAELSAARHAVEAQVTSVADAARAAAEASTRLAELTARLAGLRGRISSAPAGAPDVGPLRAAIEACARTGDALAARAREAVVARDGTRAALAAADEAVAAARGVLGDIENRQSQMAETLQAREIDLAVAQERARDAGPPPDSGSEPSEDPAALVERVEALERRRAALGVVNPLAAEERAALTEREDEITAQIADLAKAVDDLKAHMREMDEAVSGGFDQTFATVSARFGEVVELLFPGGTGQLRLVEPEEEGAERGVEIEVVPAGKRPRPMTLLSGGERSLVALGFLLALAMSRPAPVYVLDEVEAALDDVNLRRFLGVVRRLAEETQFVLITHQQPTVEVADTLFGVTMGQDGVSQILARRLARSVDGPAKPYVRRMLRALPGGAA